MNSHQEKILAILNSIRPEYDFASSEDFVEEGLLDSFDVVTLVSELEAAYGVVIDGLDIVPENFSTVDTIIEIVRRNGGVL